MAEPSAHDAMTALLAFLPTMEETRDITILSAWVDESDRICVVYEAPKYPSTPAVGLRTRLYFDAEIETLEDWVLETALCQIGEPLGSIAFDMWLDDEGVYWWGEVPVPGRVGRSVPLVEPRPWPPADHVSEPGYYIGPPA